MKANQADRKTGRGQPDMSAYHRVNLNTISNPQVSKSTQRQGGRKPLNQPNQGETQGRKSQSLQRGGRRLQTIRAQPSYTNSTLLSLPQQYIYNNYFSSNPGMQTTSTNYEKAIEAYPSIVGHSNSVNASGYHQPRAYPPRAKSNYRSQRSGNAHGPPQNVLSTLQVNEAGSTITSDQQYLTQNNTVTRQSKPENLIIRSSRGLQINTANTSVLPKSKKVKDQLVYVQPAAGAYSNQVQMQEEYRPQEAATNQSLRDLTRNSRTVAHQEQKQQHSTANSQYNDPIVQHQILTLSQDDQTPSVLPGQLQTYESALNQAIAADQKKLECIQQDWQEVNRRIQARAQLLQTLQITNESAREKAKLIGLNTLDASNNRQTHQNSMIYQKQVVNHSNDSNCIELGSKLEGLDCPEMQGAELIPKKRIIKNANQMHGAFTRSSNQSPNILVSYETNRITRHAIQSHYDGNVYTDSIPAFNPIAKAFSRQQLAEAQGTNESSIYHLNSLDATRALPREAAEVSPVQRAEAVKQGGKKESANQNRSLRPSNANTNAGTIKQDNQVGSSVHNSSLRYNSLVQNQKNRLTLAQQNSGSVTKGKAPTSKHETYLCNFSQPSFAVNKKTSPEPKARLTNDINKIAQVYRQQGRIVPPKKTDKGSIHSDPHSVSFERSEPRNTLSLSRERNEGSPERRADRSKERRLGDKVHQTIHALRPNNSKSSTSNLVTVSHGNTSSYAPPQKQAQSSQMRRGAGSKKRGAVVGYEEQQLVNSSILVNESQVRGSRPKLSSQVTVRKGISKSTLRSNLKSLQNQKQLSSISNSNMRGQCTQSLAKERMGSVTRAKVLQGSIILQQPNRVQLKKSIQHATYQNQMAQQTIDMANQQMIKSQNVGEAINITIASLTGLLGGQAKPNNGTNGVQPGLDHFPSGQNSFYQQAPARVQMAAGGIRKVQRPQGASETLQPAAQSPLSQKGKQGGATVLHQVKKTGAGQVAERKTLSKRVASLANAYNCSAPSGVAGRRDASNSNSRSGSVPAHQRVQQPDPKAVATKQAGLNVRRGGNGFKSTQPNRDNNLTTGSYGTAPGPDTAHRPVNASDGAVQLSDAPLGSRCEAQYVSHLQQSNSHLTRAQPNTVEVEDSSNFDEQTNILSNQFSFKKIRAAHKQKHVGSLLGRLKPQQSDDRSAEGLSQEIIILEQEPKQQLLNDTQFSGKPTSKHEVFSHRYKETGMDEEVASNQDVYFDPVLAPVDSKTGPPQAHIFETFSDNILFNKGQAGKLRASGASSRAAVNRDQNKSPNLPSKPQLPRLGFNILPIQDTTITSSKFELNIDDKEALQEFLSAHQSLVQGTVHPVAFARLNRDYSQEVHSGLKPEGKATNNSVFIASKLEHGFAAHKLSTTANPLLDETITQPNFAYEYSGANAEQQNNSFATNFQPFTCEDEEDGEGHQNYRQSKQQKPDQAFMFGQKYDNNSSKGGSIRYETQQLRGGKQVEKISERYNEEVDPSHSQSRHSPFINQSINHKEDVLMRSNTLNNSPPEIKNSRSHTNQRSPSIAKAYNQLDQSSGSCQNMLESIDLSHDKPRAYEKLSAIKVIKKDNFINLRQTPDQVRSSKQDLQPSDQSNVMLSQSGESLHRLHSSRIFSKNFKNESSKVDQTNVNNTYMPILDFGKASSASLSNKSPPMHSDDEVTPRRGLEDMMSARKLEMLEVNLSHDHFNR